MSKKVTMYTFKTCPYCLKAKALLDHEKITYEEILVSYDELDELEKRTNLATVPQIFVGDQLIGGCDDLYKLHKNKEQFDQTFFD